MKSFKYIATLAVAAAGLATQADAIPITYSYTGANFTFGTGPAGFTTNDNITASFTVNKPLAPDMNLCPDWWPELLWRLHFPLKFPGEIPRPGPVNYPLPINEILANLHIHTLSYFVEDKAAAQQMRKITEKRIAEVAGNLSKLHDEHYKSE